MKTGTTHNDIIYNNIIQSGENLLNQLLKYAVINATKYSISAGRNNLATKDIIIALQYEAHEFSFRNHNDSDSDSDSDSQSNDNDSDSDSQSNDNDSDSNSDSQSNDFFTYSQSNDPLIVLMNKYHNEWNNWNPETPIEHTLKNAVNSAIIQYNTPSNL